MSEDEQELNIVKLFKSELKLISDALIFKIHNAPLAEEQKHKHEDLVVKLLAGTIVTKINGGKISNE